MHTLWNTIFYQPIYNALIFTIDKITFGDIGFAIIFITILIKFILLPLATKSIKTQILMKRMDPEMKQIKKDFPGKEEQAKKTFELYKKYGTSPFSGCLIALIQLPIIIALYRVFLNGISFDPAQIYSFIHIPTVLHTNFLGFIEIHSKSIILAILAGGTQFIQGYLANPIKPKVEVVTEEDAKKTQSFQEQMSDSMQTNIKYMLPIFIAFISYQISAAVALYFIASNTFTIIQESYIRKTLAK